MVLGGNLGPFGGGRLLIGKRGLPERPRCRHDAPSSQDVLDARCRVFGFDGVDQVRRIAGERASDIGPIDILHIMDANGCPAEGTGQKSLSIVAHGGGQVDAGRVGMGLEAGIENIVGASQVHLDPDVKHVHIGERSAGGFHHRGNSRNRQEPIDDGGVIGGPQPVGDLIGTEPDDPEDEVGGQADFPQQGHHQGSLVEVVAPAVQQCRRRAFQVAVDGGVGNVVVNILVDEVRIILEACCQLLDLVTCPGAQKSLCDGLCFGRLE